MLACADSTEYEGNEGKVHKRDWARSADTVVLHVMRINIYGNTI